MYYGKFTPELKKLFAEYEKIFGCQPDGYENAEYGVNETALFIEDIRKALEQGKELPELYPDDDEF